MIDDTCSPPPHTDLPYGTQVSDMTPTPKVGVTRVRLRRDTDSSVSKQDEGGGETCEYSEAARPQSERALAPHNEGESFDSQEIAPELSVDEGDANRLRNRGV